MTLADIFFDFNPNSVFVFSTVQVFSWKEEIGYSVEYNKSVTLCNGFVWRKFFKIVKKIIKCGLTSECVSTLRWTSSASCP